MKATKNPAPSANGGRASKTVKAGSPDGFETTLPCAQRQAKARKRLGVTAAVLENGTERHFTVHGQTAKALLALMEAGPKGCTALEVASWAYRFSAYCFDLIHKHGLKIRTDKEEHPGGWHGRHVLESDVRFIKTH